MSTTPLPRFRSQLSPVIAYALAVVLPILGSFITQHVRSLAAMPFAAHFIAAVCVAALGGLWPAVLSIAVSVFVRNFLHIGLLDAAGLQHYDVVRVIVILFGTIIISVARNSRVHSHQKLERALIELQDRNDDLVASLNSSKCACWIIDLDSGRSARWYSGSYPVFGRPFAEIERLPSLIELLHPEDRPRLVQLREEMRSSVGPLVFEHRVPWPDGEIHWLEMRGNRIPGKPCVWRGVTVDVTERKLAETALLHAEKLAAMGRIASTVAHEINNPLEAVTNLLYLARSDDSLEPATSAYLASAERELARLSNITRLTLGFVRISGETAVVDLAAVAADVVPLFQHRLDARDVRLFCDCAPGVRVRIAPHELRQIVTNLIANAADAVTSPAAEGDAAFISLRVFRDGTSAVLLVEDNGEGIYPHNLPRVFEAFFSTKAEVGTGIGLWVSKELAEKHGGRISVASTRERGTLPGGISTSFRVELPLIS